jgi:hypothetical protein
MVFHLIQPEIGGEQHECPAEEEKQKYHGP